MKYLYQVFMITCITMYLFLLRTYKTEPVFSDSVMVAVVPNPSRIITVFKFSQY